MQFSLIRKLDGLRYIFSQVGMYNNFPLFKREDSDVFIRKDTQEGWVCCDENGIIRGKVWSLSDAQNSEFPPEGDWVSMKGEKSYVYVLEYN